MPLSSRGNLQLLDLTLRRRNSVTCLSSSTAQVVMKDRFTSLLQSLLLQKKVFLPRRAEQTATLFRMRNVAVACFGVHTRPWGESNVFG